MTKAFLALHVIAVILAIGPVAVAASMFPAVARRSASEPERKTQLTVLHRICRVYARLFIAVPVFGFATAACLHVLGTPWLVASMALTATAAIVLTLVILPTQQRLLDGRDEADVAEVAVPKYLMMSVGVFNLLWATVTVLMILRPGSTTGA